MKLVDLKLTNFKKLSNIPQPTISFNEDITVLVVANNAGKTSIRHVLKIALSQLGNSDIYNVYHTPLYLDSKGEIQEEGKFIPLSQIKNQRGNGNKANIRGLLYALKKEEPSKFDEFKKRLLEIFTELEDMDVRNNEELGIFELVLYEKLKRNGDSKLVDYDIKNVGQGMQTLVLMLSNILLLKPSIVLMDEPEVHMHPSLIKEFVRYVKQLSVDIQFIITTHSVVLMNEVGLDKLISLKYEVEQKGVIATPVDDRNKLLDAVNSLGYHLSHAFSQILNQLQSTLEEIRPEDFCRPSETLGRATIGHHLRHTLEFFICLENGFEKGVINYDKRDHDKVIETDKFIALATIGRIREFIFSKSEDKELKLEVGYDAHSEDCVTISTSYFRELTYNIEHAIHHMAIMKIGVREFAPYITLAENFGVAVSTVRYRQATSIVPVKG